jgi:hypothetical protein
MRDSSFADRVPTIGIVTATRYFKGGGSPTPPPPPPPPSQISAAEVVKKNKQADNASRRQGFESTILTSGLGVSSSAPSATKTLLGN